MDIDTLYKIRDNLVASLKEVDDAIRALYFPKKIPTPPVDNGIVKKLQEAIDETSRRIDGLPSEQHRRKWQQGPTWPKYPSLIGNAPVPWNGDAQAGEIALPGLDGFNAKESK